MMAALPLHTGGLPQGELLGRYRSYEDAQKVVDHLAADQSFDVKALTIVGNELRSVEKVRGRLSYPRVAGTGALQGALFGAFMGLLLMLFSPQDALLSLGMAVLMGMAIWMIIGVVSFAARRGSRGFVSASQLVATSFDVVCDAQVAGKARQLVQGAGVTSLNAWNDPTGRSAALSGGAPSRSPQAAAAQPTTTPQPSPAAASPPEGQGGDAQDQSAQNQDAQNQNAQNQNAQPPAEQQSAPAGPAQRFEEQGRPRYGVRLAEVQEPESAPEDGEETNTDPEGGDSSANGQEPGAAENPEVTTHRP